MTFVSCMTVLLLLVRVHLCCTPNSSMEEIFKLLRCKMDEAEEMWQNVRKENDRLKSTMMSAGLKSAAEEFGGKRGGEFVITRPGITNQNATVAVVVEREKDDIPQGQTLPDFQGDSRHIKREVKVDSEQFNAGLLKQNEDLKDELKNENDILKEELKLKSDALRKDLISKNEQLKAEMKGENEIFKAELQRENELLIVQLKHENEELKADLKNKSVQLKVNMWREKEELKIALKRENEQFKIMLKTENDMLKAVLKNESEHLKTELQRENDLLKTQLDKENEELMIQLQQQNNQLKMVLKNKTEELKRNLEEEFNLVNEKLLILEKRNKIHNFSLAEVKKKMSKLLTYCQMLSPDICGGCTCADDFQQENKYFCDCTNLEPKRDCLEHYNEGNQINGIYTVHFANYRIMRVFCDQENGGWVVFQRRMNGKESFFRDWRTYKNGFGDVEKEFWIGNDNLNIITSSKFISPIGSLLRVDLTDWSNRHVYAVYDEFKVDKEDLNYKLHISGYSGTAGDSLSYHNNMLFSSSDKDNDVRLIGVCSKNHRGPWWHKDCHESNLNGEYLTSDKRHLASSKNIIWRTYKGYKYSMKYVEMKVRRRV